MTNDLCHANAIRYDRFDGSFTVSETNRYLLLKISDEGSLDWILGGSDGDFSGEASWTREYGHQMTGPNRVLIFSNGAATSSVNALAFELDLDTDEMTAENVRSYNGQLASNVMGDVQRLPGDNTLITYSIAGFMHEVDEDGGLVRSIHLSGPSGFAQWRPTLYGPPPDL